MKDGLDSIFGHSWERIEHPHKSKTFPHYKHWDKDGFVDDGPALFLHCELCDQYFWGALALCPKRTIKVLVQAGVII